jgi:hypothetical protein
MGIEALTLWQRGCALGADDDRWLDERHDADPDVFLRLFAVCLSTAAGRRRAGGAAINAATTPTAETTMR